MILNTLQDRVRAHKLYIKPRYPTPRNDAGILNWADYLSSGTVWITAVSSTEISGAVSASDGQRSVDLRGASSSPICPGQDASERDWHQQA